MQKFIKLAVIAGFTVAAGLAAFVHKAPASEVSSETISPHTLYIQNCARCHGSDGRANTSKGRQLDAADLTSAKVHGKSSARIERTIKYGHGDMPAFGKRLTSAQIASLAGYVRSL